MSFRKKLIIKQNDPRLFSQSGAKLTRLPDALINEPFGVFSFLNAPDRSHAISITSTGCMRLYAQTNRARQKRILEKLVQATLDELLPKASKILDVYPEFLLTRLGDYGIQKVESQFTWREFQVADESVFSIAQKLLLSNPLKMMVPHFLKRLDEAQRAPDAQHAVLEIKKQWILAPLTFSEHFEKEKARRVLMESYIRDYISAPLMALAADTEIQVNYQVPNPEIKCYEVRVEHISPATAKALDDWRAELLKPKAIQDCTDINQLLIAAYSAFDSRSSTFQNGSQRCAFSILVIGFIQSLVNPSLGKAYCEDLVDVAHYNKNQLSSSSCVGAHDFDRITDSYCAGVKRIRKRS